MTTCPSRFRVVFTALAGFMLATWVHDARAVTYDIGPASGTITTATPVVTVPIMLSNFVAPISPAGNGAKNFQVTISLTSGLKFANGLGVNGSSIASIAAGSFLTGTVTCPGGGGDATPITGITDDVGGTVTIIFSLSAGKCAVCATSAYPSGGVIATISLRTKLTSGSGITEHVRLVAAPIGAPTASPTLNDCSSQPIAGITYGISDVSVLVNLCSPITTAPTITSAAQSTTGISNPASGLTGIKLTWTNPAGIDPNATLDVWRAPFGYLSAAVWQRAHPEYDDDNLFIAQAPFAPIGTAPVNTSPSTGWAKVAANPLASALTFTDTPPQRGYWYYVANITDGCNTTQISNMSTGTLDYLLGDVTNGTTVGQGDDVVDANDASAFGSVYGTVVPTPAGTTGNLDIGPTMDRSPTGRPHPDDFIGFEDLIILSMNFSKHTTSSPQFAGAPAAAGRDELALEAPSRVQSGASFSVALRMQGAGDLRAVSTQLGWDPSVAEPVSVRAGALALSQDGLVLSSGPGNVDVAVLGRDRAGLLGDGVIATVSFRAKASGDPRIGIASVDARDRTNQKVELASHSPVTPLASGLAPASPNPFKGSSAFSFSLGKSGSSELAIFSVDGRRVRTLFAGTFEAGSHRVAWDGTDDARRSVKPGLYFARLVTPEGRFSRSVVVMK